MFDLNNIQDQKLRSEFRSLNKDATKFLKRLKKLNKVAENIEKYPDKGVPDWLDDDTFATISFIVLAIIGGIGYLSYLMFGWIYAIVISVIVFLIIIYVSDWYVKETIDEKQDKAYEDLLSSLKTINASFKAKIIPKLIGMGLFSIDDIQNKTEAAHISKSILELLIENNYTDTFNKIKLSEEQFIYECTLPEAIDNIETEYIEFDYKG